MQRTTRLKKPQVPEPGELINFDDITGRPKYAGEEMTSETNIPSVTAETEARQAADQEIWTEIETIEAASDVVDVVGTYADLEAYDTSKLHDKDLIKVLQDETRDDAITYYRFSKAAGTFSYVGSEGPYYTASETDTLLSAKQDTLIAGSNVQIAADGKTISATDTTYSDFVGATVLTNGENGLVPAPLSTDVNKFLQGDGSWGTPTDTTYTAGTNVQISAQNVISATDTTYSDFTGATSSVAGAHGLVPAPATTDADKFLKGDGTWAAGGASATKFYVNYRLDQYTINTSCPIYKDSAMTEVASYTEVRQAIETGSVIVLGLSEHLIYTVRGAEDYGYKYLQLDDGNNGSASYVFREFGTDSAPDWKIIGKLVLQSRLTQGSNITISGNTISARDTTYSDFTGATSSAAGAHGLVPAPAAGDEGKVLKGNGSWGVGYERVELYLATTFDPTLSIFEIYKDSARHNPITWTEFRYLLTESNKKDVVLHAMNSSDTMYTLLEYWDDTTEFSVFDTSTSTIYYITSNTGDPGQTKFVVDKVTELQEKLTAGSNITITNGTISATVPATNNISSNDWSTLWQ